MADNNGGGGFVLGLFVGGVIGAMIGLLMAPKSGSQTRADLWDLGDAWRSRADEMAAEIRTRGMTDLGNVIGRVGPAVDSLRHRDSSTVDAVCDASSGARESISSVHSTVGAGDGAQATVERVDEDEDNPTPQAPGTA